MTEDLERSVRQRIVEGFSPAPAGEHEDRVRAQVRVRTSWRGRRRRMELTTVGILVAALVVGIVVYPRIADRGSGSGLAGRRRLDLTASESTSIAPGAHGLLSFPQLPFKGSPPDRYRRQLNVEVAGSHLLFQPQLPPETLGVGSPLALYTFSEQGGLQDPGGLDNAFDAIYANGLQVMEVRWDPALVHDASTFASFVAEERELRSRPLGDFAIGRVKVLAWTSPASGSSPAVTEVAWFRDGIGYALSSPTLSAGELLAIARTMIH